MLFSPGRSASPPESKVGGGLALPVKFEQLDEQPSKDGQLNSVREQIWVEMCNMKLEMKLKMYL